MTRDQANYIAQYLFDDIVEFGGLSKDRFADCIQTASIRYKQHNVVSLASKFPTVSKIKQWTDHDGVVYMQPIAKE